MRAETEPAVSGLGCVGFLCTCMECLGFPWTPKQFYSIHSPTVERKAHRKFSFDASAPTFAT
jgi:hypothetical protein